MQIPAPRGHLVVQPESYLSISPDAKWITFGVDDDERIWIRSLAADDARPIEGTTFGNLPFWSPDRRWIGFFAEGKLKKVGLDGSPPVVLCDASAGRGGSWNREGVIVFAPRSLDGIYRVSANGGAPVRLSKLDPAGSENTHRWSRFLPDGRHFLYLAGAAQLADQCIARHGLRVVARRSGETDAAAARAVECRVRGRFSALRPRRPARRAAVRPEDARADGRAGPCRRRAVVPRAVLPGGVLGGR